jgi:L-ascorbate metabolism protein UlaG (beta-lactamase superfamily)
MRINTRIELEEKIARARVEYPALWRRFIREWREADSGDCAWLMYAANYLLYTGGVRWAMDPFSLATRIGGVPHADYAADLESLELVLLTHAHNDHLDLNLIGAIAGLPIQWIVPEFMLDKVTGAGVPMKNIIVPVNGKAIAFKRLGITPFAGQHIHERFGVPETGYLVESGGKRWLFLGDTRVYDLEKLPDFGPVDAVFAHVWLGKACADLPIPPLLDAFCQFYLSIHAKRILLTHLEELGRDEKDLWDKQHVKMITHKMEEMQAFCKTEVYFTGGIIDLD